MNGNKYVGMDIYLATISCAVLDADGNEVMSLIFKPRLNWSSVFCKG